MFTVALRAVGDDVLDIILRGLAINFLAHWRLSEVVQLQGLVGVFILPMRLELVGMDCALASGLDGDHTAAGALAAKNRTLSYPAGLQLVRATVVTLSDDPHLLTHLVVGVWSAFLVDLRGLYHMLFIQQLRDRLIRLLHLRKEIVRILGHR